jgi:hypothetical protein
MSQPQGGIAPQPVPEVWSADLVTLPTGEQAVVIQIQGVSGTHVSFLPLEGCEAIVATLTQLVTKGKSKIILPPGVGNLVVGQFGNSAQPH